MRSSFLPRCKCKIIQGFLPYQKNKDHNQKNCLHLPKNHQKKCHYPFLYGRAEIIVIFGLHLSDFQQYHVVYPEWAWHEIVPDPPASTTKPRTLPSRPLEMQPPALDFNFQLFETNMHSKKIHIQNRPLEVIYISVTLIQFDSSEN